MIYEFIIKGLVQGVGYRPHVIRMAKRLGLAGDVRNTGGVVKVRVCFDDKNIEKIHETIQKIINAGQKSTGLKEEKKQSGSFIYASLSKENAWITEEFKNLLVCDYPPGARIDSVEYSLCSDFDEKCFGGTFKMAESDDNDIIPVLPADIGICKDCVRELSVEEGSRFYAYPFISCAKCGPRFSIMRSIPYDRKTTSMDEFEMCPKCRADYENAEPGNRRFLAQTISCPDCGPRLFLNYVTQTGSVDETGNRRISGNDDVTVDTGKILCFDFGTEQDGCITANNDDKTVFRNEEAFKRTVEILKVGGVAAVKNVGGYHLVCDAGNPNAVEMIRKLKRREAKPFAVMVKDVPTAEKLAVLSDKEKELLESDARPIVLVERYGLKKDVSRQKQDGYDDGEVKRYHVCEGVCLNSPDIGIMLPSNGLQYLLAAEIPVLVMTSANFSGELIISDDEEIKRFIEEALKDEEETNSEAKTSQKPQDTKEEDKKSGTSAINQKTEISGTAEKGENASDVNNQTSGSVKTDGTEKDILKNHAADATEDIGTNNNIVVLGNNRKILCAQDDSVARVLCGRTQILRRSRGYVPQPVEIPGMSSGLRADNTKEENSNTKDNKAGDIKIGIVEKEVIFACGADMKSAFALGVCDEETGKSRVYFGKYLGDLGNASVMNAYVTEAKKLMEMHGLLPETVVCDMHPSYFSIAVGEKYDKYFADYIKAETEPVKVQHHVAHSAAVLAEHGLTGPAICFAFDGTGFAGGNKIWGGEVFSFDGKKFRRRGHLREQGFLGGDAGVKDSFIILICYYQALQDRYPELFADFIDQWSYLPPRPLRLFFSIISRLDSKQADYISSSCGRLFDAVSAKLGICRINDYEGRCACELEYAARKYAASHSDVLNRSQPQESEVGKKSKPAETGALDPLQPNVSEGIGQVLCTRENDGLRQGANCEKTESDQENSEKRIPWVEKISERSYLSQKTRDECVAVTEKVQNPGFDSLDIFAYICAGYECGVDEGQLAYEFHELLSDWIKNEAKRKYRLMLRDESVRQYWAEEKIKNTAPAAGEVLQERIKNVAKADMDVSHERIKGYLQADEKISQKVVRNKRIPVILSGGCFANRLLTELSIKKLEAEGFLVYTGEKVPPGDDGIALGQYYIASQKLEFFQ